MGVPAPAPGHGAGAGLVPGLANRRPRPPSDHRDPARVGNVKYVWELSHHHHLSELAAAHALTRDDRYAERIAAHLRSWCRENPFLSGIHWTSALEVGLRLIAWTWIRRLLNDWDEAPRLFEIQAFVKLEHEPAIVRCELSVQTAREGLPRDLLLQDRCRLLSPGIADEPWLRKCASRRAGGRGRRTFIGSGIWWHIRKMMDALSAIVDVQVRPPQ